MTSTAAVLPAVVDNVPAAAAADDAVVVVANEIRSAETAAVGPAVGRKPVLAAGNDVVLPEFIEARDREPTVVAAETGASVSDSMLVETLDSGPDIQGGYLIADLTYRVAQNKIPHRRICNISAATGLIFKALQAA